MPVDQRMLKAMEDYFYKLSQPRSFKLTTESILVEVDAAFEDLCCVLEDCGTRDVKQFTVFEFYKRVEYYEKKFKKSNVE